MDSKSNRLKVHRRELVLGDSRYTVLSPRQTTECRFATNLFHDTWHVVADVDGAHLLARLCWAMAYQRHDHTVAVIDPAFIVPSPFDADPSSPIVIANTDLGPFPRDGASSLRQLLPFRTPSNGTVVLQTRGLDLALDKPSAFAQSPDQARWLDPHRKRRWIEGSAGLVILAAPGPVLKNWGFELSQLGDRMYEGTSYTELDYPKNDGEVQVLDNFDIRVERAVNLRNQLFPDAANRQLAEEEKQEIWTASHP
jgi:hypothetical protein